MTRTKKKKARTYAPPNGPQPATLQQLAAQPQPRYHPYAPARARPPTTTRTPGVDFARLSWGAYEARHPTELVVKLQGVKGGNIFHDRIRVEPHETAWHIKRYLAKYCGYAPGLVRLVFDGHVLDDSVSFAVLGTEEGDVIDVSLAAEVEAVRGPTGTGTEDDPIVVE